MSRFLLPVGMTVLVFSALAFAAQVREEPKQTGSTRQQTVAPNKGLTTPDKAASPDKTTRRGHHKRVYLGVYTVAVEDMSKRVRKRLHLPKDEGVVVVEAMPDSPAEEAGLRHGDVITHVNGKLVEDEEELSDDLCRLGAGKQVKLSIIREGKKQEITAELEEGPSQGAASIPFDDEDAPRFSDEHFSRGAREAMQRMDRLERKVSRLEKQLRELEKTQSIKKS